MSYILTTVVYDQENNITFRVEKCKMKDQAEIKSFKYFSTMVRDGNYIFLSSIKGKVMIREGSCTNFGNDTNVCIFRGKPDSIKINGKEYIKQWLELITNT